MADGSGTSLRPDGRPPVGTVTFPFSDIEGSTRLLGQLGDRCSEAFQTHQRLLRSAFQTWHGFELGAPDDAFCIAFARPADAVMAAVMGQRLLAGKPSRSIESQSS
jgi:class 3 adenylate cyclase